MLKKIIFWSQLLLSYQVFASNDFYFTEYKLIEDYGYGYFCEEMSDENCDYVLGTLDYNTYKGTKGTIISKAIIDDYHTDNKVFYKVRLFNGKEYYHLVDENNEKRIAKHSGLILAKDKEKIINLEGKEVLEGSDIYFLKNEKIGSELIYKLSNNQSLSDIELNNLNYASLYLDSIELNKILPSLTFTKMSKNKYIINSKDLKDSPVDINCNIGDKYFDFCSINFNFSNHTWVDLKSASISDGKKIFGLNKNFVSSNYVSGAVYETVSFSIEKEDIVLLEELLNSEKPFITFYTKYSSPVSNISLREIRGLKNMMEIVKNIKR